MNIVLDPSPSLVVKPSERCSLCKIVKLSVDCPRCRRTGYSPVLVGVTSANITVDGFVYALRQADPVPVFVATSRVLFDGLQQDRVSERMLGVAGVQRIDVWMDWHERFSRLHASALAYINRSRVGVQRPLDPVAAGWTRDDVFVEAYRLGWLP